MRERSNVFVLTLASDQHPGLNSHSLCLSRKYVQTHLSSLADELELRGLVQLLNILVRWKVLEPHGLPVLPVSQLHCLPQEEV